MVYFIVKDLQTPCPWTKLPVLIPVGCGRLTTRRKYYLLARPTITSRGAKPWQRLGNLPAWKKALAPGSLRISSMSRFNGQVFVSWAASSSCQMAVAERVCFSRAAEIRELKPPEPGSHFKSFSMTFKKQHKHTVRDFLATGLAAKLQIWVLSHSALSTGS